MLRNGDSALTKARGVFSAFTLLPGALSLAARAGLLADGVVIFSFRTTSLHGTRGIFFACRAFGGDAASSGMGRRFGGRRRFPAHVAVDDEKPRSPRIACPSRPSPDCRSVFPALMSAVLPSDEGVFGHEALPRLRALFLTGDVLPKACRPSCCRRAPFQRGFPVCLRLRRQARRLCCCASFVFPAPGNASLLRFARGSTSALVSGSASLLLLAAEASFSDALGSVCGCAARPSRRERRRSALRALRMPSALPNFPPRSAFSKRSSGFFSEITAGPEPVLSEPELRPRLFCFFCEVCR